MAVARGRGGRSPYAWRSRWPAGGRQATTRRSSGCAARSPPIHPSPPLPSTPPAAPRAPSLPCRRGGGGGLVCCDGQGRGEALAAGGRSTRHAKALAEGREPDARAQLRRRPQRLAMNWGLVGWLPALTAPAPIPSAAALASAALAAVAIVAAALAAAALAAAARRRRLRRRRHRRSRRKPRQSRPLAAHTPPQPPSMSPPLRLPRLPSEAPTSEPLSPPSHRLAKVADFSPPPPS